MFGWLHRKAMAMQAAEMRSYTTSLSGMDGFEVAMILALATDQRHRWAKADYDILDPMVLITTRPNFVFGVVSAIKAFQREKLLDEAASLMIWLHTIRAATSPELRILGREMWRELRRGIPHVMAAKSLAESMRNGTKLNCDGYENIPIGLEPEVR